jgi:hypothetical protein
VTLDPINEAFAARLSEPKEALLSTDADAIDQLGSRVIPFTEAPAWPELDGLDDEPIIESFLVSAEGELTPLSDAPQLAAWQPRAHAMATAVLDACAAQSIQLDFPAYLTCSITPVGQLEGNPHFDDDQFVPGAGLGLVAINGEHIGPRVATGSLALTGPARPGPMPIADATVEDFRNTDVPAASSDEIAILAQFGQLHAGPAARDVQGATHRQLLVLRAGTQIS